MDEFTVARALKQQQTMERLGTFTAAELAEAHGIEADSVLVAELDQMVDDGILDKDDEQYVWYG